MPTRCRHSVRGDGWISDRGLWQGLGLVLKGRLELGVWISVGRVGIRVKGLGLGLGLVLGVRVMIVGLDR